MPTTITLQPDHRNRFWYRHPHRGGWSTTKIIIGINLVLFAWMILRGLMAGRGLSTILNPDLELLVYLGAQNWVRALEYGEWWRCISYAFTHGGLLHLAFNMVALYQVGLLLEKEAGHATLIFVYTFSALTATFAGYIWHPNTYVVGASGALFGLIGFAVVFYRRLGDPQSLAKSKFMLQWAMFAFLFGFAVHADNAGHLGGAIGGAVIGLILPPRFLIGLRPPATLKWLAIASILLVSLALLKLVRFWIRLETGM